MIIVNFYYIVSGYNIIEWLMDRLTVDETGKSKLLKYSFDKIVLIYKKNV